MLIKKIAKMIFKGEIKDLEQKIDCLEKEKNGVQKEFNTEQMNHNICKGEKEKIETRCRKLERENEILRKYYDLDSEPSDEIKMKMHIDIEINKLKEENNDLKMAFFLKTMYIQQPYYPIFSNYPIFRNGRFL